MTPRKILWMWEGRRREKWAHTSNLLAMIYNMNRGPKSRAMEASKFNPFCSGGKSNGPVQKVKISDMRGVIMGMFGGAKRKGLIGGTINDDPRAVAPSLNAMA